MFYEKIEKEIQNKKMIKETKTQKRQQTVPFQWDIYLAYANMIHICFKVIFLYIFKRRIANNTNPCTWGMSQCAGIWCSLAFYHWVPAVYSWLLDNKDRNSTTITFISKYGVVVNIKMWSRINCLWESRRRVAIMVVS